MELIQSKQNQRIKDWRKLQTSKGRRKAQQYIIEGQHLIEEALRSHVKILTILVTPKFLEQLINQPIFHQEMIASGIEIIEVTNEIMASLTMTETSQGVLAIVGMNPLGQVSQKLNGDYYLLCDSIQDPGNLGTMIRTADAAGFDGVLIGEGCVDLYNDKVIRSTQGSLWHLPLIQENNSTLMTYIADRQLPVYATALHQEAKSYRNLAGQKGVLVLGNEAKGVSSNWLKFADEKIYIPMPGRAESLNVAVAAGILMFAWSEESKML